MSESVTYKNKKMYRMKRVLNLPSQMLLPECMYKMRSYNSLTKDISGSYYDEAIPSEEFAHCEGEWLAVEKRQINILSELKKLNDKLDTFNCPSTDVAIAETLDTTESRETDDLKPDAVKGQDLVISCPPSRPLYSIHLLKRALQENGYKIYSTSSTHSSVKAPIESSDHFNEEFGKCRQGYDLYFSLQWKDQKETALMVNPIEQHAISGESNIVRYISRLFPFDSAFNYESFTGSERRHTALADFWLDEIETELVNGDIKKRMEFVKKLNSRLEKPAYILGENMSVVDILAWSIIAQLRLQSKLPTKVSQWFDKILDWGKITLEDKGKEVDIAKPESKFYDRCRFQEFLENNSITYQVFEHPEVFTVDTMMEHVSDIPGMVMKNLFLKDKKGKLFLLAVRHNAQVKLKDIGTQLSIKDLRFGDEKILYQKLGVRQGCVTLYALINDCDKQVSLLLDETVLRDDVSFVNFHPMSNSATLGISPTNLKKFLELVGHEPVFVKV